MAKGSERSVISGLIQLVLFAMVFFCVGIYSAVNIAPKEPNSRVAQVVNIFR